MAEKKTKKTTTSHKPRSTTSGSNGKPERGAKTAFIRQHMDKTPQEVVRLAGEHGLALSPGYVSNQQSKLRKKGGGSPADTGVAQLTKLVRTIGVRSAKELVAIAAKLEEDSNASDFVDIVQGLGIDRARDVITIIETVDGATNKAPDQSTAETT